MSNNVCRVCHNQIMQMCRKNTGICGEICEKAEKQPKVIEDVEVLDIHPPIREQEMVTSVERPTVPSLLGQAAADKLQSNNALMEGDIRRGPHDQFDVWTGSEWTPCERPEKVA